MNQEYYLDIEIDYWTIGNKMNFAKITNKTHAISAIQNRSYIVGSLDEYGNISFSTTPVIQGTEASAKAEASRLAQNNPGKTFMYVQFRGGFVANQLVQL